MEKKEMHNILIKFMLSVLMSSIIIFLIVSCAPEEESTKESIKETTEASISDFITLYPGVYTEREKPLVEKYFAENKALEERGEIDVQALINGTLPEDTPGIGPSFVATEAMIRYNNEKYDPENPVLNNAEYAKKLGYKDILAYPTFGAHDDTFLEPYPSQAIDKLLVSDLNHSVTSYKPVYPGDTLYLIVNERHVTELSPPEGSIYRSVGIKTEGSIYNQRGEKVNDVIFGVTENVKIYKEDKRPEEFSSRESIIDWTTRPQHYYTDEDWEFIKDLWSKEERQGSEPLYWEDINIGDEPTWTVDGPIEESVRPTGPYGIGTGGSRTMKKEIMDPEIFRTMIRGEKDGIYRLPNREDYVPTVPEEGQSMRQGGGPPPGAAPSSGGPGGGPSSGGEAAQTRSILINFLGRDIAIRHINNWMGDHGWLYNIRWSIVSNENRETADGYIIPVNPRTEHFLEKVPEMKGKKINVHGLTGDLAIVKSYVYNKYVLNDEFFLELIWWIESIEGDIWEAGRAIVKLPSQKAK